MSNLTYNTVSEAVEYSCEIKKSRFIALVAPVRNEEEIEQLLQSCKNTYPQARHYVYAWRLGGDGERQVCQKYSDDGEPCGTAGLPIMKKILGNDLSDVLVIVVRYFGGILLGTGGLSRAYAGSATEALKLAGPCAINRVQLFKMSLPYNIHHLLAAEFAARGIELVSETYGEAVDCELACLPGQEIILQKLMSEYSGGKYTAEEAGFAQRRGADLIIS